ncbi:MAG TPA: glycoside hydrolase family 3 N-terminal domain-containing protein [Solirubrobacteraceae bacterium]|jgi:beta-N-acetylhexosaminidase
MRRLPVPRPNARFGALMGSLLVLALAVAGGLAGRDRGGARPLPPGGSQFGTIPPEQRPHETLLDALAPLLAPQSAGAGATGANGHHAPAGPRLPLPLGRAVAQLFVVGFPGRDVTAPILKRLHGRDWGGVLLQRTNFVDPVQLTTLTTAIAQAAHDAHHVAPIVALAQVGGTASELPTLPPAPEPAVGATRSPRQAAQQAAAAAAALKPLGVSMTLAPDADLSVAAGPAQERSFSDDPAVATRMTAAAVRAYRDAKMISAVGRFPGEGAASQDPEQGAATVGLSLAQLRAADLRPFVAIAKAAPAIAMSDAVYAAWDGVTPATLLPDAVRLLRGLGFRGVIVSGDLTAATAVTGGTVAQAAVDALRAGVDLLVVPGDATDQESAYRAVLDAVRRGILKRSRIVDAVKRVLALKRAYRVGG